MTSIEQSNGGGRDGAAGALCSFVNSAGNVPLQLITTDDTVVVVNVVVVDVGERRWIEAHD